MQGAWLLLCCHALQGGSAVSGKVQRCSHPGLLGGCSVCGTQGWRPVYTIWVCDHIRVWGCSSARPREGVCLGWV